MPTHFSGVLIDHFTHRTDEGNETVYCIKLFAKDRKSILLFKSRHKKEAYNILKHFSPALGLPALEEKDSIIVELNPEDIMEVLNA